MTEPSDTQRRSNQRSHGGETDCEAAPVSTLGPLGTTDNGAEVSRRSGRGQPQLGTLFHDLLPFGGLELSPVLRYRVITTGL